MTTSDPDRLLAMLRDPNVETQEIAAATGAPREEVGRAARLLREPLRRGLQLRNGLLGRALAL